MLNWIPFKLFLLIVTFRRLLGILVLLVERCNFWYTGLVRSRVPLHGMLALETIYQKGTKDQLQILEHCHIYISYKQEDGGEAVFGLEAVYFYFYMVGFLAKRKSVERNGQRRNITSNFLFNFFKKALFSSLSKKCDFMVQAPYLYIYKKWVRPPRHSSMFVWDCLKIVNYLLCRYVFYLYIYIKEGYDLLITVQCSLGIA